MKRLVLLQFIGVILFTLIIDASNQLRFWHEYGDLFRIGGDGFVCNFSYGVYYKKDQMSFETVMSHADEKMYEMKKKTK